MIVQLVPVVELPSPDHPIHRQETLVDQEYSVQIGYSVMAPVDSRVPLYETEKLTDQDWRLAISRHIADTAVQDSCALFGGILLKVDGENKIFPQCCGTLADVVSWQTLLSDSFDAGWVNTEGHPCPSVVKRDGKVTFFCSEAEESFIPFAISELTLDQGALGLAFDDCLVLHNSLSERFDAWSAEFDTDTISDSLIWEPE